MAKRLRSGKGIKVKCFGESGEIVRSYFFPTRDGWETEREYEIRLGPAHFIYLKRKDFELVDTIIKFDTLVKLRQTDLY